MNLWISAWQTESGSPEPFLPVQFENWADNILLTDFSIVRDDVTASDIRNIYIYLSQQEPPSFLYETL